MSTVNNVEKTEYKLKFGYCFRFLWIVSTCFLTGYDSSMKNVREERKMA